MEKIAGFVRTYAQATARQSQIKPFLRKPFLRYGQCYAMAAFYFQTGSILGAKYRHSLGMFGHAFLGQSTPGKMTLFCNEAIKEIVPLIREQTKFHEFVIADQILRCKFSGDSAKFLLKYGMTKLSPDEAVHLAWQYAANGVALGVLQPFVVSRMFEHTHKLVDKAEWYEMHARGLAIPPEQDYMSHEEAEDAANQAFLVYCANCCPVLYDVITEYEHCVCAPSVKVQPEIVKNASEAAGEYDIVLGGFDSDKKTSIINVVKESTGLCLEEATELVEDWPSIVNCGLPLHDAEKLVDTLEKAGATAWTRPSQAA